MNLLIWISALIALTMADDKSTEEILHKGNSQFTSKMFAEVARSNPDKSIVMSGFSVLTPLAQLVLASVGDTHDEILQAIDFPNDEAIKSVFSLVNRRLRSVNGIDLKMASKVYIPNGFELNDNFTAISRDLFSSEVKNVDFSKNQETAEEINSWVESQTDNHIKDLVDPMSLDPNTRAVLINAIYFKGNWHEQFDKQMTSDRDFYVSKDNIIKLPTMYKKGNFKYGESTELDAKLLSLPYIGEESSLLIVLPNEIEGINTLKEKLKEPSALANAIQNMYKYEVEVLLPKFKIETTINLKATLENINVKKIFRAGEANLNNLLKNTNDLYVSDAIQKTYIEVNEDGTEAAAANGILALPSSFNMPEYFVADRPFYFEIRQKGLQLINGVFIVPTE